MCGKSNTAYHQSSASLVHPVQQKMLFAHQTELFDKLNWSISHRNYHQSSVAWHNHWHFIRNPSHIEPKFCCTPRHQPASSNGNTYSC